jgi:tripartite ATP-independent transporter DctM subunit
VGALFHAAVVPGLLLSASYALYIVGVSVFRPALVPALPPEAREKGTGRIFALLFRSLLPPLALIVVVLGSIFAGIATPTEAGALGAVGACVMAMVGRRLTRKAVTDAVHETSRLTAMVIYLLIGSTAFALVFRGLQGDLWLEEVLTGLPGGAIGFLIVVNLIVFVLGYFIDFFEICFIIVPLIAGPAALLGIDPVWLGIILAMNLQTSFLTPPFGFSLFYLRGVTPKEIPTTTIYRGVIPFIVIQVLVLAGTIAWMFIQSDAL